LRFLEKQALLADNQEEDWETFRHFVRIIQIVGDLMVKYETLEETLDKQIQANFIHRKAVQINASQQLDSTECQPFDLLSVASFKEYLLDDSERVRLNKLIAVIESGIQISTGLKIC
jgi:hypothetical protein